MSTIINATTTNGVVIEPDNSGSLELQTNSGTTALTIDTSQNVGIGTTSPVNLSGQKSVTINASGVARTDYQISGTTQGFVLVESGYLGIYTPSTQYLALGTNDTERMRIDSSGNVLIGQTTNTYSGKLAMSHNSSVDDGLVIRDTRTTGGSNQVSFIYNTTQVGRIHTTSSATTYATSSDYRLKENILPMTGALDKVLQLKPVTYTWKQDGSNGQGFIAHELQAVVPDAVVGEKDAIETYTDEYGIKQTRPKYQGIDTSFLVATLTAAIQEQQTIINDLKARVETLEAK
jgi:hypothetical protein